MILHKSLLTVQNYECNGINFHFHTFQHISHLEQQQLVETFSEHLMPFSILFSL